MARVYVKRMMEKEINNGLNLFIQRKSKQIKCTCFDEVYQTGNPECDICGGEGVLYIVQKEKAVLQKSFNKMNEENTKTSLGSVDQSEYNLYLKSEVNPKINDKIFLAVWENGVPIGLKQVLKIQKVDPIINSEGKILLYNIFAKNSPKHTKLGTAIIKKARQRNMKIGDGFYVRPI